MHSRLTARNAVIGAALTAIVALAVALSATAGTKHANGNTILIGSIAGTTGAYGSTGVAMVNGAKLAVSDLNARGGALGRRSSRCSRSTTKRRRRCPRSCSSGS